MVIVGSCKPPYCAAGINAQPDCAFVLGMAPRFQHGAVPPLGCIANGLPLLLSETYQVFFGETKIVTIQ
jgi:hypothetical protein